MFSVGCLPPTPAPPHCTATLVPARGPLVGLGLRCWPACLSCVYPQVRLCLLWVDVPCAVRDGQMHLVLAQATVPRCSLCSDTVSEARILPPGRLCSSWSAVGGWSSWILDPLGSLSPQTVRTPLLCLLRREVSSVLQHTSHTPGPWFPVAWPRFCLAAGSPVQALSPWKFRFSPGKGGRRKASPGWPRIPSGHSRALSLPTPAGVSNTKL